MDASFIVDLLIFGARAVARDTTEQVREAYAGLRALLFRQDELRAPIEAVERNPSSLSDKKTLVDALRQQVETNREVHAAVIVLMEAFGLPLGPNYFESNMQGRKVNSNLDLDIIGDGEILPTPLPENAEYQVWYGTNRAPILGDATFKAYSAQRDTKIHYGTCKVFIPKSHKIGSTGSTWWKRLLTHTDDRLRLLAVRELDADTYWQSVTKHLDAMNPAERHAAVFIHGYNVTFEQAALRAAQIGFDLSIRSAMAFFSWPSQGRLRGYMADAAAIDASEGAITQFLIDFSERSGARTIHIIAHSMGNRGVLRAVEQIAEQARRRSGKRFGQVILAAADVDADLFHQRCAAYTRVAHRATLYVSTRDLAVEASRWLHNFPRAGLMPPVLIAPGIDTINVANVDLTQLGHGYIAETRDVLADIHRLIQQDTPPDRRFGLRAMNSPNGGRFWTIGA